jgi:hypothetical protein
VLPRQVQVWFQNKRQRERKISRSLGLFSTPGLPDTPAATAAKTAHENRPSAETGRQPAVKANAESADGSSGVTTGGVSWPGGSGLGKRRLGGSTGRLDTLGVPITRAASCPNADVELLLGAVSDGPLSLDDTAIPIGHPGLRAVALHGKPGALGLVDERGTDASLGGTALTGLAAGRLAGLSPRHGSGSSDLDRLSPLPWLSASVSSGQLRQSEARCREAVARARAALDGDGPADSASLTLMTQMGMRLPILQSLMPPALCHLPGLGALEGVGSSLDSSLADLPDDIGRQLAAELLTDEPPLEYLEPDATTRTADILLEQTAASASTGRTSAAPCAAPAYAASSGTAGLASSVSSSPARRPAGGRALVQQPAIKKRAVPRDQAGCPEARSPLGKDYMTGKEQMLGNERGPGTEHGIPSSGVPFLRSGVSGLLDHMHIVKTEQELDTRAPPPAGRPSRPGMGGEGSELELPLTEAEACMQAAADEYVQVITSAASPFEIIFASAAWLSLCEFEAQSHVIGQTLQLVEGPLTQHRQVERLEEAMRSGATCALRLTHHTRTGRPFSHDVRLEPLRDSSGKLHCFQATSSNILMLDAQGVRAASQAAAQDNAEHAAAARNSSLDAGNSPGFGSPDAGNSSEVEEMSMSRSYSGLKIHEMLDLFHAGRGAPPASARPSHSAAHRRFSATSARVLASPTHARTRPFPPARAVSRRCTFRRVSNVTLNHICACHPLHPASRPASQARRPSPRRSNPNAACTTHSPAARAISTTSLLSSAPSSTSHELGTGPEG